MLLLSAHEPADLSFDMCKENTNSASEIRKLQVIEWVPGIILRTFIGGGNIAF